MECEVRAMGFEARAYQLSVGDVFRITGDLRSLLAQNAAPDIKTKGLEWMIVTARSPESPSGDFSLTLQVAPRGLLKKMGQQEPGTVAQPISLLGQSFQIQFKASSTNSRLRLPYRGRAVLAYPSLQEVYGVQPRPMQQPLSWSLKLEDGFLIRYKNETYLVDLNSSELPLRRVRIDAHGQLKFGQRAPIHGQVGSGPSHEIEVPASLDVQVLATSAPRGFYFSNLRLADAAPALGDDGPLRANTVFTLPGDESVYLVLESQPANHSGIAKLKIVSLLPEERADRANLEKILRVNVYDPDAAFWVWQGQKPTNFLNLRSLSSKLTVFGTLDVALIWRRDWLLAALKSARAAFEEQFGTQTQIVDFVSVESLE